ncbi:MAG TPA: VC0807 family protein [Rhizomicrobium sp.]|jgi:hypothetical protein|nr:VC0807 family protein [Rhizomicrobium sp.]
MTDLPPPAAPQGPDRGQMFRNIGGSLAINALAPYLVYRFSAPHYPHDSIVPLLYSTVLPALWLAYGTLKKRSVDAIAIIAICELVVTITVTLLAANVGWALIARALQGALVGLVFAGSVAIGRPVIYYIARQFAVGADPARAAGFDMAHTLDKGRTFSIATLVWAAALIVVSGVSATLAATLDHATYLLVAPILSIGVNVVLIWWSIRFAMARLLRFRPA